MPVWIASVIFALSPSADYRTIMLPAPTEKQIKLVEKLGDKDFFVREEAQKALEKMDSEAYLALARGKYISDPEVRFRVLRIIPKVMRYNVPKEYPSLFGAYNLKVKLKSGREFCLSKEEFINYYRKTIDASNDSQKNGGNLRYMTYLLPQACHYLFQDLRLLGFSKQDIDELIPLIRNNFKKMNDNRTYEYDNWLR